MERKPYGILIVHGFASSLDSVIEIEPPLKFLGFPIRMPVLRGHGGKSPETLHGVTWHDWVADADGALKDLLTEVERVIIVGHSMGGLIALKLAADHPDVVDSIILAAAAIHLASPLASGHILHFLVPLIIRLFRKWDLPPVYTDKSLARNDTNYHWAPMDSIVSFLELSEETCRFLPEIRVPALILQSRKDTTVAPESAEIIYKRISTPTEQKKIIWFDETEHEMFRDCEREAIIKAIVGYVKERVKLT